MSQKVSPQRVAARPIRALIIQPDNTYEVREVAQELKTLQGLVGGYVEAVSTDHCTFWCDEEGDFKRQPCNILATYLWWKIDPTMEAKDVLQGSVFATGVADDAADSLPVSDGVIDLFERIEQIWRETEGEA
jgi:hypothetical protein